MIIVFQDHADVRSTPSINKESPIIGVALEIRILKQYKCITTAGGRRGEDCDFCDFLVQNSIFLESSIRMYLWKRISLRLEFVLTLEFGIFSVHIAIVLLIN